MNNNIIEMSIINLNNLTGSPDDTYIHYDESMPSNLLNEIGLQYLVKKSYDNMKICLSMAIEKSLCLQC